MKKYKSIIQDRFQLEIGLGKRSSYRHKHSMLKKVVLNPSRQYRRTHTFIKKDGRVSHEPGTGLIFNFIPRKKRMNCHYAYECRKDAKPAYTVPLPPCYDVEAWQESTNRVYVNAGHRASVFMLQKNGYLLRRDMRTGALLDEIYLPPEYKFVEMIEDREVGYLYLKSKIYGKSNEDVFAAIVVFSFPPLEFSAFFEVKKSIFGKTALKAEICQGAMLVMHSNSYIKLYSLKDILIKFLVSPFNLGDMFSSNDVSCCVGKHPLGLPLNVCITDVPPVLLEVKSAGHNLQIGGHPWHYITCPSVGQFQVHNLMCKQAVEGGLLEESSEIEPDIIVFHPDESLKIVHVTSSKIVVYRIIQGPCPRLETFVSVSAFEQQNLEDARKPERSSFGRKLSPTKYIYEKMSLMMFDYEDELDIFALLKVKQPYAMEGPQLQVIFTDPTSGQILGLHNLPDCSWPMVYDCQYSFEIDGPLLVVTTKKHENMKNKMFVFLLVDQYAT